MRRYPPFLVPLVALAVVVVGGLLVLNGRNTSTPTASASTSPTAATGTTANATNAVAIQNYAFAPAAITVKVGTVVTWTNQDAVRHSVTSSTKGSGPESQLFGRGETYSYTFATAGTYSYYCLPHPYMKGTVTVTQ